MYFVNLEYMTIFALGKTTGVVMECGQCRCMRKAVNRRLNMGGRQITEYMSIER